MTEAEARAALAAFDGIGGLERWIAAQRPWEAVPGGWTGSRHRPEAGITLSRMEQEHRCGTARVRGDPAP